MSESDKKWMERALELAELGRGWVEPNPLVGAVLVREGRIVGEGWHERFGQAHAEIQALSRAGQEARNAVLYVTLEPCCHHGKTPPCTQALIDAGISRVVAAMEDPFPQVAGQGGAVLRAAGILVDFGVGAEEARRQNAPYLKLLHQGMPYVHAKWAMSLDGKIATCTGDSKWISSETSRRLVHTMRGKMDAIIVGIGTVLHDDPSLTARPPGPRTPCRVILDSRLRVPLSTQVVCTARDYPTLIAVTRGNPDRHFDAYKTLGCEVLEIPADARGRPDLQCLLQELGRRRWTNLLVEGGSEVLGSFLDAHLIDEFHVFIAPLVIGGKEARTPLAGLGAEALTGALRLSRWQMQMCGDDYYLHGWTAP